MRLLTTDSLFAWDKLPDTPELHVLADILDNLPDGRLLFALRSHRGHGRNDYPMHVLWRIHLTRYLLRHVTMEACLDELKRNPALRKVVGIELPDGVPTASAMSRFLKVLGRKEHLVLLQEIFEGGVERLGQAVPDLGRHLAGDSSALSARADPEGKSPEGLPQPNGAKKEYFDEQGKVVRTLEWFGYKAHLLVDATHEVIVAMKLTRGTDDDAEQLPDLLDQAQRVLPTGRIATLAYDKAADKYKTHALLAGHQIKPVIENRSLWKNQTEEVLPGCKCQNVVFDEAGTLYCYDMVSQTPCKRKMSFIGYEKSRGTLKFRCPARHEGIACRSDKRCNGDSSYGRTVRVKSNLDLRRFPPIPRTSQEFKKRYKGRTSVERVNARLKLFWGADDGNVTGAERFHAHVYSIVLVHLAFAQLLATSPRYEGQSLSPTRLSVITRRLSQPAKE